MEVRRTAVVKLEVSDEQRDALHRTAEQFLWCANQASEYCWNKYDRDKCVTVKRDAQAALYDDLRAETDLTSNLVILAIYRAVEAVKGCVERWKKRQRVSQPHFDSWAIDFDKRSSTVHWSQASLSTVDGRIECDYELPTDSPTPYERYVLGDEFELRTSTLRYDETTDEFYLHVSVRSFDADDETDTDDTADAEHQTVLGIDLGVNSLAVASTGTFWQGDDYDHWINEFEKRRSKMQQRGTQAAHNAVLRLGKHERAWRKQYLHTVANELVDEAVENDCDTIVFEDLEGIRERLSFAEWHHVWAFRRLVEYVQYKAPERGVEVETVEPQHTSQRCSKCGFTATANRDGTEFHCQQCEYAVNADYNASKNVGLRYARQQTHRLRSGQKSLNGDAPVSVRLNRGTVTDDGPLSTAG
jgi:IS605 OrfB family transposase